MVRGFRLLNEKGQEFSMMDIYNYCLLSEPSGLGYSYQTEYEQLGNTFVENIRKAEKGQFDATILFSKYDNYKNFVDYIETSEELRLAYKIPFETGEKEYLRDIEIQSISKSEIQTTGIISESIVIDFLSLWYEENKIVYTIKPQANEIRWDFKWNSKFTNYDVRKLQYINQGHVEAPVIIEIDGHIINPKIDLYVEGQLYQSVTFNVDIGEYEKLLYGTKENDFYIKRQKTDGTTESLFNLDVIDFEKDNVIRLPRNKSCEIRLSTESGEIVNALITIFVYYKAV